MAAVAERETSGSTQPEETEENQLAFLMERLLDEQEAVEDFKKKVAAMQTAAQQKDDLIASLKQQLQAASMPNTSDASSPPRRGGQTTGGTVESLIGQRRQLLKQVAQKEMDISSARMQMCTGNDSNTRQHEFSAITNEANRVVLAAFRRLKGEAFAFTSPLRMEDFCRLSKRVSQDPTAFLTAYRTVTNSLVSFSMSDPAGFTRRMTERTKSNLLRAVQELVLCFDMAREQLLHLQRDALDDIVRHESIVTTAVRVCSGDCPMASSLSELIGFEAAAQYASACARGGENNAVSKHRQALRYKSVPPPPKQFPPQSPTRRPGRAMRRSASATTERNPGIVSAVVAQQPAKEKKAPPTATSGTTLRSTGKPVGHQLTRATPLLQPPTQGPKVSHPVVSQHTSAVQDTTVDTSTSVQKSRTPPTAARVLRPAPDENTRPFHPLPIRRECGDVYACTPETITEQAPTPRSSLSPPRPVMREPLKVVNDIAQQEVVNTEPPTKTVLTRRQQEIAALRQPIQPLPRQPRQPQPSSTPSVSDSFLSNDEIAMIKASAYGYAPPTWGGGVGSRGTQRSSGRSATTDDFSMLSSARAPGGYPPEDLDLRQPRPHKGPSGGWGYGDEEEEEEEWDDFATGGDGQYYGYFDGDDLGSPPELKNAPRYSDPHSAPEPPATGVVKRYEGKSTRGNIRFHADTTFNPLRPMN